MLFPWRPSQLHHHLHCLSGVKMEAASAVVIIRIVEAGNPPNVTRARTHPSGYETLVSLEVTLLFVLAIHLKQILCQKIARRYCWFQIVFSNDKNGALVWTKYVVFRVYRCFMSSEHWYSWLKNIEVSSTQGFHSSSAQSNCYANTIVKCWSFSFILKPSVLVYICVIFIMEQDPLNKYCNIE